MTPSSFGCSFADLGDVVRLGWFEYNHYYHRFAAHKPSKYTATYGADNLALLQDFLKMDDAQAHTKAIQAMGDIYFGEVKSVNTLFKTLKNFIDELTSDKATRTNLYKDAGQQAYDDRGTNSLPDNDKLLKTMIQFIQPNQAALLAKDLPANFVQQLTDKRTSLATTNADWLSEKAVASAASDAKNTAGNELKSRLSAMFKDAQAIFGTEKDIGDKFVFDTLLAKVRGPRDAGVGGKTISKATEKGVEGITVFIASLNISVVSDADGRWELSPLPEGIYILEAKGEGFKPFVLEKRVVKAGVIGRLTIEMEAL